MYAQCPHCRTIFFVSPEQLETAGGRVRCGHCYKPFNGHGHLVDQAGDAVMDQLSESAEALDPALVLREEAPLTEEDQLAPPTDAEAGVNPKLAPIPAERDVGREPAQVEPEVSAAEGASELTASAEESVKPIPGPTDPGEIAIPELLQGDLSRLTTASRSSWLVRLAQLTAVVALLIFLGAQYAWFMPRDLLARVPAARNALAWAYERIDRDLPVPRDISHIHLLSRDVRVHPDYGNVLLVNAQLINKAPYPQPFPTIRLVLFGVNGEIIAARGFRPDEYLESGVRLSDGMRPHTPVQFGMELVAPGTTAVSYEFQFL